MIVFGLNTITVLARDVKPGDVVVQRGDIDALIPIVAVQPSLLDDVVGLYYDPDLDPIEVPADRELVLQSSCEPYSVAVD